MDSEVIKTGLVIVGMLFGFLAMHFVIAVFFRWMINALPNMFHLMFKTKVK